MKNVLFCSEGLIDTLDISIIRSKSMVRVRETLIAVLLKVRFIQYSICQASRAVQVEAVYYWLVSCAYIRVLFVSSSVVSKNLLQHKEAGARGEVPKYPVREEMLVRLYKLQPAAQKHRKYLHKQTNLFPKPPYAWWLKDTSARSIGFCITQKDTQPIETCSEDYIFLLLYVT